MLREFLFANIILMNLCGILGQSFGDPLRDNQIIEINAAQQDISEGIKVTEFDIYRDGEEDQIALEVHVPVNLNEVNSADIRNIYILDFSAYTPTDNPIEGDLITTNRVTNCSNYQLAEPQSLASQFEQDLQESNYLSQEFFDSNITVVDDTDYYFTYTYRGSLERFTNCEVYDRDNVWSVTESNTGRTEYSTTLAVNHIRIKKIELEDDTIYQPSYFSTIFQLSWRISQYIFVNGVVASQKRVTAEVTFASVQPLWEDGKITDKTRVLIGIRTVLDKAWRSHVMMVHSKVSDSGTFSILIEGEPPISISAERISYSGEAGDRVLCQKYGSSSSNPLLEEEDNSYDCVQTWEFSIILPQNVTTFSEIDGLFSFELQLYQCDNLDYESPNCEPVPERYEQIFARIALDTVVEITAEQESALKLEVTAIRSKNNAAEFLASNPLSRGIYHGEEVVVYIQPTQNINKAPGADLISEYGLALSAFLVCIEQHVPRGSKLGCLEVEQQYRYIPWMEDDLSVSLQGKIFTREDFEDKKQELNSTQHTWNPETGFYTIEFKNLALSSVSRLYRFTMIFRVDVPEEDDLSRKRRSVLISDMTSRVKRGATITAEDATVLPLEDDLAEPVISEEGKAGEDGTEEILDSGNEDNSIEETTHNDDNTQTDVTTPEQEDVSPEIERHETEKYKVNVTVEEEVDSNGNVKSKEEVIVKTEEEEDEEIEEGTSPDESSLAVAGVSVKGEVCPPGEEFVSSEEPCRVKESGAGATKGATFNILLLVFCLSQLVVAEMYVLRTATEYYDTIFY
ncbi:hypothetical protein ACHWQZ_G002210 [Mnemiopsis leidyi]